MPKRLNDMVPTWTNLNIALRCMESEVEVGKLVLELKANGANTRWIKRAVARYRQLRKIRERREFERGILPYKGPRKSKGSAA